MAYIQQEISRYQDDSEVKLNKLREIVLDREKQMEIHLEQSKNDLLQATNSNMKALDNLVGDYA
jgi:hexokinase